MTTETIELPESKLTRKQYQKRGPRPVEGYGKGAYMMVEIRYDDECGNGHNTFAITADVRIPGRREYGCMHEEIAKYFPELAKYIKWHLVSSDGPMHYVGSVLYFAGDRDCWGHYKGQPYNYVTSIHFGNNPIKHKFGKQFTQFLQDAAKESSNRFDFEVIPVAHEERAGESYKFQPKYTFGGFDARWHECPFDSATEALDFLAALQTCDPQFVSVPTAWGEGKARELDKARHAAIWPEATDEELTAPDLKDKLIARLPKLMEEFKAAMEELGFVY